MYILLLCTRTGPWGKDGEQFTYAHVLSMLELSNFFYESRVYYTGDEDLNNDKWHHEMAELIDAVLATENHATTANIRRCTSPEKFEEWFGHTNLLAGSIGVNGKAQRLRLTLPFGGKDLN